MPRVALREAVFEALKNAVASALPDAEVTRNDPDPASSEAVFPRINTLDGRHTTSETETAGEVFYSFEWMVEGWVKIQTDDLRLSLASDLNALQAAVIEAMVLEGALELPFQEGTLEIWVEEPDFDLAIQGVTTNQTPTASFLQSYEVTLRWPRGRPFIDLL
jgi:hypothetical protein